MFTFIEDTLSKDILGLINPKAKFVPFKNSTINSRIQILKSIFKKEPLYLYKHFNPEILIKIDELMLSEHFDIVHCDHTAMAPIGNYLKQKYGTIFGLRLHNIEWMIWERYAKSLSSFDPKKYYVASQAKKLKSREIQLIKNADVSFPITENDKNTALEFAPNSNLVIATGGVNQDEFLPKEVERKPLRLIIATTYSWVHNVNGLIWFMESVLPLVLKKFPEVEIELIGKNPPDIFRYHKNIILKGYVDKVQPYLNSASIYIAPLFVGSGIRIKILEAMAMELPVIATTISAEGISAKESDGLFISNDPDITANTIIRLLDNPTLCRDLGKKARKFILENFTWERSVKTMYDEYIKLLNHTTSLVNKPLDG